MPDRDGIEGPYPDGTVGCATCGASRVPSWSPEVRQHRRKCGRRWRKQYPQRRTVNADERRITEAIERETGSEP